MLALAPGGAGALDIEQDLQPPDAEVRTPYSFQLTAEEGCVPYYFELDSGRLPPGLAISREQGTINGTPTEAGTFEFYGVTDSVDCNSTPSQGFFRLRVLPRGSARRGLLSGAPSPQWAGLGR